MRKVLTVALALVLMGTVMLPSAAAVHGSRYMAVGIAFKTDGMITPPTGWVGPLMSPADDEVYTATVLWTGYTQNPRNHYFVTISDPATGEIIAEDSFQGLERWGCCITNGIEYFQYHGCAAIRVGWSGQCIDSPDFDVYGIQIIHIQTQQQMMLYTGWYQDFALKLVVEGHVDELLG